MEYKEITSLLEKLKNAYENVDAEVEMLIKEPATEEEVEKVENELDIKLPIQLREFFLNYSKHCEFSAWLPDDFELPEELEEIFSACFEISLEEILIAEHNRKEWVKSCFFDKEDEYATIWHEKLGFMAVPNGDSIAFDIKADPENPPIVYLSHDDGEGHGYIFGKDFMTYLKNLLLVGACGNEDWQMLPFCEDEESGIDPECENAKEYRRIIGLKI